MRGAEAAPGQKREASRFVERQSSSTVSKPARWAWWRACSTERLRRLLRARPAASPATGRCATPGRSAGREGGVAEGGSRRARRRGSSRSRLRGTRPSRPAAPPVSAPAGPTRRVGRAWCSPSRADDVQEQLDVCRARAPDRRTLGGRRLRDADGRRRVHLLLAEAEGEEELSGAARPPAPRRCASGTRLRPTAPRLPRRRPRADPAARRARVE